LAARLCGVEVVGIVTDIPLVMIPSKDQKRNLFEKIIPVIDDNLNNAYTSYVLLTQQMCRYINRYNRPSCIMEGVVDVNMKSVQAERDDQVRNILFAGGLVEANGIRQLVEAFRHIKDEDLRLSVYGSGPLEKEMELFMRLDSRLKYYGAVPNAEVMEAELKATLLVNPRFTNAEYTKYSFPSKNLEYMASGVPVLTTCLPGMPKDYYDHIYLFRDESLQGYIKTLSQVLALPEDELKAKGRSAKDFVLREKNNISQTAKILEMVRKEGLSVDIRKINFV
jgi:glycosyltransferase involved in cell wall biosynthesis